MGHLRFLKGGILNLFANKRHPAKFRGDRSKPLLRYGDFSIFTTAAAAILDF